MRFTTLTLLGTLTACSVTSAPALDDLAAPPARAPTEAPVPAATPVPSAPVPSAPSATPTPAPLPTEGAEAAPTVPTDDDAASAMRAYRATIAAYNAHDADAYFGSFIDPLACFHGTRAYGASRLRASRGDAFGPDAPGAGLHISELTVLRESPDEVVLLDRGAYWIMAPEAATGGRPYMEASSDPIEQGVHERAIVMRLVSGTWRIAAETDRAHLDCIEPAVVMGEMPAALTACRAASTACLRGCDGTCIECGACNGCNLCPGECLVALAACTGAPETFSPYGE